MANIAGPAYPLTGGNCPHPDGHAGSRHQEQVARNGRARRRQLRRHSAKRWLDGTIRMGAIFWLVAGMLLPLIMHRYTNTQAAPAISGWQRHPTAHITSPQIAAGIHAASPTTEPLLPTATASPTPTATPTPTPLPAHLIQATAWQATLDQAAVFSHATQTQAAGQYSATQTALPPILTANALDRAATSTAAVVR
jgi:hypothetical protein